MIHCSPPRPRFLARSLKATSKFGAAFDQLADLTCFGVGPAIFYIRHELKVAAWKSAGKINTDATVSLLTWPPPDSSPNAFFPYIPSPSWLFIFFAGFLYMASSCARIARELVVHNIGKPEYFVGIPTNLACPILLLVVYLDFAPKIVVALFVLVLSALMIMPVEIPKDLGTGLLRKAPAAAPAITGANGAVRREGKEGEGGKLGNKNE